jgi:hypothetical protein
VSGEDDSILLRSLLIEMPGAAPFTIDPGEEASYAPEVMVVENPSGPPLILFQTYSGGAHCCTTVQAIVERSGRLEPVTVYEGDGGPLEAPPVDLDGDGTLDFRFYDNAFLYRFASYADSFAPPLILNLVDGRVMNVSERSVFRRLFERTFTEARARCVEQEDRYRNGACAAYVASAARLGRFDEAWAEMERSYDRSSDWGLEHCAVDYVDGECPQRQDFASFPEALRHFLADTGYVTSPAGDAPNLARER